MVIAFVVRHLLEASAGSKAHNPKAHNLGSAQIAAQHSSEPRQQKSIDEGRLRSTERLVGKGQREEYIFAALTVFLPSVVV